ncbi:MAG: transposase family protein, partial [Candidatus Hadarchaeum sp.]
MTPIRTSLQSYLEELVDPRRDHGKRYPLTTVIILAIVAIIAGANDWVAVARYCKLKRDWLATFLDLSCGIPSHDTFRRVF